MNVKENLPMTRSRLTAMTRCRWPTPPTDGKELGILFKASGGRAIICAGLSVPAGVVLQLQEKGSYRLEDVLEYMEWVLDRSRIAMGAVDVGGLEPSGRRVAYLLDWFAPHLNSRVDELVHSVGHAILCGRSSDGACAGRGHSRTWPLVWLLQLL